MKLSSALPLVSSLAVGLFVALAPSEARADGLVSVGVGALAIGNISFLGKPGDRTLTTPTGFSAQDTSYPGFAGFGGGAGAMIDLRFFKAIGIEVDFFRTNDRGHGDINSTTIDIGQAAFHLPILLKGTIPFGLFHPQAFVGPELVFKSDATAETTGTGILTKFSAVNASETMITFGLGAELALPIPSIDIRIPFSVRGSVNPSTSDKVADRANYTFKDNAITAIEYKSDWQYRIAFTLGAAVYF
jgi:hypothetical protein